MALAKLDGESEVRRTYPHFLAFFSLYTIWLYFLALGVAGFGLRFVFYDLVAGQREGGLLPASIETDWIWSGLWVAALVIPATAASIVRANFKWLFVGAGIAAACIVGGLFRQQMSDAFAALCDSDTFKGIWTSIDRNQVNLRPHDAEPLLAVIVGVLGIVAVEIYRSSHTYILTNKRLIARFGILAKRERDLLYSRITDIVVHQGLLGRIFNFGTVIPISPGGIGGVLNSAARKIDQRNADGSTTKVRSMRIKLERGKTVSIPRGINFYILWGVPNPSEKRNIIVENLQEMAQSLASGAMPYRLDEDDDDEEQVRVDRRKSGRSRRG